MAAKQKKKTPLGFLYLVIGLMAAAFCIQMVFPTDLGKIYDKCEENAARVTVTVSRGDETGASYATDSLEKIKAFGVWADTQVMRNRSLADGFTAKAKEQTEYNLAFQAVDGTYSAIVIDERGFVHFGAELYKVSGDVDKFLDELKKQLESWEEE